MVRREVGEITIEDDCVVADPPLHRAAYGVGRDDTESEMFFSSLRLSNNCFGQTIVLAVDRARRIHGKHSPAHSSSKPHDGSGTTGPDDTEKATGLGPFPHAAVISAPGRASTGSVSEPLIVTVDPKFPKVTCSGVLLNKKENGPAELPLSAGGIGTSPPLDETKSTPPMLTGPVDAVSVIGPP